MAGVPPGTGDSEIKDHPCSQDIQVMQACQPSKVIMTMLRCQHGTQEGESRSDVHSFTDRIHYLLLGNKLPQCLTT